VYQRKGTDYCYCCYIVVGGWGEGRVGARDAGVGEIRGIGCGG